MVSDDAVSPRKFKPKTKRPTKLDTPAVPPPKTVWEVLSEEYGKKVVPPRELRNEKKFKEMLNKEEWWVPLKAPPKSAEENEILPNYKTHRDYESQGDYDAKRTCVWCGEMVKSPEILEAHELECTS